MLVCVCIDAQSAVIIDTHHAPRHAISPLYSTPRFLTSNAAQRNDNSK